jgi:SET domain-containing protein
MLDRVETYTETHQSLIDQMEVRASAIHGRGTFIKCNIDRRRKLGEISGELVSLPGARKKIETQSAIYFIELNTKYALDCSQGNILKFLNHSCKPNCYLRIYRNRVEVYSLGKIDAGAELTIDYDETPHKNGMECNCGAEGCRGLI